MLARVIFFVFNDLSFVGWMDELLFYLIDLLIDDWLVDLSIICLID